MPSPVIPEIGVLAFVPDRWDPLWQPRHHVLTRLARYYPVVWVTPPSDWRQAITEIRNHRPADPYGDHLPDGFKISNPEWWLPRVYRPRWLGDLTALLRIRRAVRLLQRQGCRRTVLYLWRPEFDYALRMVRHDISCYHIDDEYSFSDSDRPNDDREVRLLKSVDQVFIHSAGLLEKKGGMNPNMEYLPNGVDFQLYSSPVPVPPDLARIQRPWIGYTGFVKRQLDWNLIDELSVRHPEWSFVFVGAHHDHSEVKDAVRNLSNRGNVHFLGEKPVKVLATYPQHFDACIMPYRRTSYTDYINPMKLHEYLASGRPIVATTIRSLADFEDVVRLVRTPEEWSCALEQAIRPVEISSKRIEARRVVARRYDWDLLVYRIAGVMARRLGPSVEEMVKAAGPFRAEGISS